MYCERLELYVTLEFGCQALVTCSGMPLLARVCAVEGLAAVEMDGMVERA
jgi:hypothetical protein